MKFKYIFVIFNTIIVLFLAFFIISPFITLGASAGQLLSSLWPLFLVFAAALAGLNAFYLYNRRLLKLLEMEDWPALIGYLEQRVIRDGRYSQTLVRLLASTYLVMSDSAAVVSLENKVAIAKPKLLEENALLFGVARILANDNTGAEKLFLDRLNAESGKKPRKKDDDRDWIHCYYGFTLILNSRFDEAAGQFKALSTTTLNALVAGLSSYFLGNVLSRHDILNRDAGEAGRERVKGFVRTRKAWDAIAAREAGEVHAAVMQNYLQKTADWLFG